MAKGKRRDADADTLLAVVVMRTADGFVTGRALVNPADVEWVSPKHTRDVKETRPTDVVLRAEKWLKDDGQVEMRPTRVSKGTPVLTTVGRQVVFGEMLEACAQRARQELKAQLFAQRAAYVRYWQHLCQETLVEGLPLKLSTPAGGPCAHCGESEAKPKREAA